MARRRTGWARAHGVSDGVSDVVGARSAAGQLSVGAYGFWATRPPSTHLRYVGLDAADRDRIADAFAQTVLTPVELRRPDGWDDRDDGFEPWLGTRHSAA